jgi:hypothetical protein
MTRNAASSVWAIYHAVEHRMRRIDELPLEVQTAIESVKGQQYT